jgi:hypothetical protein
LAEIVARSRVRGEFRNIAIERGKAFLPTRCRRFQGRLLLIVPRRVAMIAGDQATH